MGAVEDLIAKRKSAQNAETPYSIADKSYNSLRPFPNPKVGINKPSMDFKPEIYESGSLETYVKNYDKVNAKNPLQIQEGDNPVDVAITVAGNILQATIPAQLYNARLDNVGKEIYYSDRASDPVISREYANTEWKEIPEDLKEPWIKKAHRKIATEALQKELTSGTFSGKINALQQGKKNEQLVYESEREKAKVPTEYISPDTSVNRADRAYPQMSQLNTKDIEAAAKRYAESIGKYEKPENKGQESEKDVRDYIRRKEGDTLKPELPVYNPKVDPLFSRVRTGDVISAYGDKVFGVDVSDKPWARGIIELVGDTVDVSLPFGVVKTAVKTGAKAIGKKMLLPAVEKIGDKMNFLDVARKQADKMGDVSAAIDEIPDNAVFFDNIRKNNSGAINEYLNDRFPGLRKDKAAYDIVPTQYVKDFVINDLQTYLDGKGSVGAAANKWWKGAKQETLKEIDTLEKQSGTIPSGLAKMYSSVIGRPLEFGYDLKKMAAVKSPDEKTYKSILNLAEDARTGKAYTGRETENQFKSIIKGTGLERADRLPEQLQTEIYNAIETGNVDKVKDMIPSEDFNALNKLLALKEDITKGALERGTLSEAQFIPNHMTHIGLNNKYFTRSRRSTMGTADEAESLLNLQNAVYEKNSKFPIVNGKGEEIYANLEKLTPEEYAVFRIHDARLFELDNKSLPTIGELIDVKENGADIKTYLEKNYELPKYMDKNHADLFNDDIFIKHLAENGYNKNDTLKDILLRYEKENNLGVEIPKVYDRNPVTSIFQNTADYKRKNFIFDKLSEFADIDMPEGNKISMKIPKGITDEESKALLEEVKRSGLVPYNKDLFVNRVGDTPKMQSEILSSKYDFYVKPELVDYMNNFDRNYNPIVKAINSYTANLKTTMTLAKPEAQAFVLMNATSGMVVNGSYAKSPMQFLSSQSKAIDTLRGGEFTVKSPIYGYMPNDELIKELDAKGAFGTMSGDISGSKDAIENVFKTRSLKNITKENAAPIFGKYAVGQLKALSPWKVKRGGIGNLSDLSWVKGFSDVNQAFEMMNRYGLAYTLFDQGYTIDQIADKIKKVHIDYSANTPFSKTALTGAIAPFISFTRGAAKMILTEPKIAKNLLTLQRQTSGQDIMHDTIGGKKDAIQEQGNFPPFSFRANKETMVDTARYTPYGLFNINPDSQESLVRSDNKFFDSISAMANSIIAPSVNPQFIANTINGLDRNGKTLKTMYVFGQKVDDDNGKKLLNFASSTIPHLLLLKGIGKYVPQIYSTGIDPSDEEKMSKRQSKPFYNAVLPKITDLKGGYPIANDMYYTRKQDVFNEGGRKISKIINKYIKKGSYGTDQYGQDKPWKSGDAIILDKNRVNKSKTVERDMKELNDAIEVVINSFNDNAHLFVATKYRLKELIDEPIKTKKGTPEYDKEIEKKKAYMANYSRIEQMIGEMEGKMLALFGTKGVDTEIQYMNKQVKPRLPWEAVK